MAGSTRGRRPPHVARQGRPVGRGTGVRRPGVVLWGLQRSGLAHSNPLGHPGGPTPGRWGRGRGPGGWQPGGAVALTGTDAV